MLLLQGLIDRWIARRARTTDEGRAEVANLKPAVVVTGGSLGIGLELARTFSTSGHDVMLIARQEPQLREAAQSIAQTNGKDTIILALDITQPDAPDRIDEALRERGFYLDVLVNNAGIGQSGAFEETKRQRLESMLDLNVTAATRLMHHVLPAMLDRGRGGILNIASLGGLVPGPYQAAYYASKAHIISLTEAVAYEVAGRGVRVCVVAPGPVNTGFHQDMDAHRSLYRILLPGLSPETVARSAYRGFKLAHRVIVPGLLFSAVRIASAILPNRVLLPIVARLLKPGSKQS